MNLSIGAPSTEAENAAAAALLASEGLPLAGLSDPDTTLFVARVEGELAGCAAIERYEDIVLLRSVATRPDHRGRGLARELCTEVLAEASRLGARTAYLLTTTAEAYFARQGFHVIPRAQADPRLSRSAEWGEICATASLMTRSLVP